MTENLVLQKRRERSKADNAITARQIAAILVYDCGISQCHAEQLGAAVVNRAVEWELPHLARFIAAEEVWRETICDTAGTRSLVAEAPPHTRIKLLNDIAAVDLALERVYEDRCDVHELVRARVHLKNHQDDLKTRTGTLGDKLTAFNGARL